MFEEFKKWLDLSTAFSDRTKSNVVSRLKRANGILPLENDPMYIFKLSMSPRFQQLTISVRSQIKRAVRLYFEYMKKRGA